MINDYQQEQLEALNQVVANIRNIHDLRTGKLRDDIRSYLMYRRQLDVFLAKGFSRYCTQACFESRTSACCGKDGIITFWADVVINIIHSSETQVEDLKDAIQAPMFANKCIYLGQSGCRWQIRPLGCALFLCDQVQADVLEPQTALREQWDKLKATGKGFRWPDRPVLFDRLELVFISAGCRSPLMYLNFSPGLLRVKHKAGLGPLSVRRP